MRKVILSIMVSLDGFIEGANKEIDWHVWDMEMDEYMYGFFERVDTIFLGSAAYRLMADYWPNASNEDLLITEKMNTLPKIVFSRTLNEVSWNNSRIVSQNIPSEISSMKQQPGKDMVLFGGAEISRYFIQQSLIDEYHIIVNPVILGGGKTLFPKSNEKKILRILSSKKLNCGNIILTYENV